MPKSTAEVRINAFVARINKAYKGDVVKRGGDFRAMQVPRFSSGIFPVDVALGGGWPFGRIVIIGGDESTGKTLVATRSAAELEKYCHNCKRRHTSCTCGDFTPCVCLFIDQEGTFDMGWAKCHGFNSDYHAIARPEHAEQAIDIVHDAIQQNIFDLIVLDSIAAMTPTSEIAKSAEEWDMAMHARLMNKALRKWNSALNKLSQESSSPGPCVMCLNQLRINIGQLFGDPRIMPGGKGQLFAAAVIVWTKAVKVMDDPETKMSSIVTLSGTTRKNKTYVPRVNYTFDMALRDLTPMIGKGYVYNAKALIKTAKALGVCGKVGAGFGFGSVAVATEKAFLSHVQTKEDLRWKLWQATVKEACGVEM